MVTSKLKYWGKIYKIFTTAFAVMLGLLIGGLLFVKLVPGFGFYIVKTGSMVPAINPGDALITRPVNDLTTGQIITFQDGTSLVTHRVSSIKGDQITTKGDANNTPDGNKIRVSDIKGVYLFKVPGVGYLTNAIHTRNGWFLIVIVPTILLVLWIVVEILKEVFKSTKPIMEAAGASSHLNQEPFYRPSSNSISVKQRKISPIFSNKVAPWSLSKSGWKLNNKTRKPDVNSKGLPSKELTGYFRNEIKKTLKDI